MEPEEERFFRTDLAAGWGVCFCHRVASLWFTSESPVEEVGAGGAADTGTGYRARASRTGESGRGDGKADGCT